MSDSVSPQPDAILSADEFDRFVVASMFGTPASEVPRVRAYVEALRRRLAGVEAERDDALRYVDQVITENRRIVRERGEWKQRSREQRARAQAAAEARLAEVRAEWKQRSRERDMVISERDELAEQVMRVQTSSEYDLGHDHGSAVAVKFKERAEAAEDRVRTLTGLVQAMLATIGDYFDGDPDDIATEWMAVRAEARAVLGSETSGEGTP